MFRDCFFTYAGIYSGDYNLKMLYVEDSHDKFASGGEYEPITDTLPVTAETMLYGIKHSEKPLEFSVEIINPDGVIPFEQMIEIKDWLFGQDGWKKLKLNDPDYNPYHLRCLLIPEEDIVDALGYRGIRCTVKNISGFWYGEEETIYIDKLKRESMGIFSCTLDIKGTSGVRYYTTIKYAYLWSQQKGDPKIVIINENNSSAISSKSWQEWIKTYSVNTKYPNSDFKPYGNYEIFSLIKGINKVLLYCITDDKEQYKCDYVEFTYTPMYRLGGF